MAEAPSGSEEKKTRDISPFKDDFDLPNSMSTPVFQNSNDMDAFPSSGQPFQVSSMNVPDRIVLDGSFDSQENRVEPPRDLKGNGVNFGDYMGGMVTPPRTLTVEDTALRFADKIGMEHALTRGNKQRSPEAKLADKNTGLFENIRDEHDDIGFRLQTEVVRLNKRVTYLEHKLDEKQSNSYWRTTLVCLLTVINPLLIHWLFNKRRY